MIVSFEFDAADRHLIVAPMTHGANTLIVIFAVGGPSFSPIQPPGRDHQRHSGIARDNGLCAANIAIYDDGRGSFG